MPPGKFWIYEYLWLIHTVVGQKATQHGKAIILSLKIKDKRAGKVLAIQFRRVLSPGKERDTVGREGHKTLIAAEFILSFSPMYILPFLLQFFLFLEKWVIALKSDKC